MVKLQSLKTAATGNWRQIRNKYEIFFIDNVNKNSYFLRNQVKTFRSTSYKWREVQVILIVNMYILDLKAI